VIQMLQKLKRRGIGKVENACYPLGKSETGGRLRGGRGKRAQAQKKISSGSSSLGVAQEKETSHEEKRHPRGISGRGTEVTATYRRVRRWVGQDEG